jgi:hypothetical protein
MWLINSLALSIKKFSTHIKPLFLLLGTSIILAFWFAKNAALNNKLDKVQCFAKD